MSGTGFGASVPRIEDYRFITGQGRYTDDITLPGQAYAYVLRSSIAHGTLRRIDTTAASSAPGVIGVFTAADLQADQIGNLPCAWHTTNVDGSARFDPPHPVLAGERVRHVGEPIALIVAETLMQARDAAELIECDFDDLPAVATIERAIAPEAPCLWQQAPGNVAFHWRSGDLDATEREFAKAAHIARLDLINNRLVCNPMEPRTATGAYDGGKDEFTLYLSTQTPHIERLLLAKATLRVPESKLRVVSPDVGGGFGTKAQHYPETVLVLWAARRLGRPVHWAADRSEGFVSDRQARDHVTHVELALDADGKFLALRVDTDANLGAYFSTFGPLICTFLYSSVLCGNYAIPVGCCDVRGIWTNTVPTDAYRGAGRPEAIFVIERIVDQAARDLGIDRAELRRRNLIRSDQLPWKTPFGFEYEPSDYPALLARALELGDYAGFEARRAQSKAQGLLRGIGISCYLEAGGEGPSALYLASGGGVGMFEGATVRVNPSGSVVVLTGTHSHGQGHETTFAQLVCERLGVPIEQVDIVHGDTGRVQYGIGTLGSRSLALGGSAIAMAIDKIIAKGKRIAARVLEASETDVEFQSGRFSIRGTDRGLAFQEVAFLAHAPAAWPCNEIEPGLEEKAFFDPPNFVFPAGAHICEVEIDPETGKTRFTAYAVVDDFGAILNPMIVDGQVHGGLAQGIGQALLEQCVYDPDTAQLLSGSFMDYTMPRADDLPSFTTDYINFPSPNNVLGVKGCGEAGTIASPPAVIGAVLDALAPLGVTDIAIPATPHAVWQAIRAAQKGLAVPM
ncbi:MAG: xanthine dehydrogenase family protein molybdopterin-binding subunit [Steroidobacteraceae bacterium]